MQLEVFEHCSYLRALIFFCFTFWLLKSAIMNIHRWHMCKALTQTYKFYGCRYRGIINEK